MIRFGREGVQSCLLRTIIHTTYKNISHQVQQVQKTDHLILRSMFISRVSANFVAVNNSLIKVVLLDEHFVGVLNPLGLYHTI